MPRPKDTEQVSSRVPVELLKEFAKLAEAHERSLSAELRYAMRQYVAAKGELNPFEEDAA